MYKGVYFSRETKVGKGKFYSDRRTIRKELDISNLFVMRKR